MMDDFLEQIAVKRNNVLNNVIYILSWVARLAFAVIGVVSLSGVIGVNYETGGMAFSLQALITAVVAGGIAFLIWRSADNLRIEYDYTFTNGNLDVSRVMNNKRRRYLTALEMKDVIRCGPAEGPAFKKTLAEPGVKVHNWFVNRGAKLTFFYFQRSGVKHVIVLELDDEMLALVRSRKYLPQTAWYNEDGSQSYGMGVSR